MNQIISKIVAITFGLSLAACATGSKKNADPELTQAVPKLKRPEVRKVWVPDQIVGDEFVSGHWKFVIEKNAVWTKSEE